MSSEFNQSASKIFFIAGTLLFLIAIVMTLMNQETEGITMGRLGNSTHEMILPPWAGFFLGSVLILFGWFFKKNKF